MNYTNVNEIATHTVDQSISTSVEWGISDSFLLLVFVLLGLAIVAGNSLVILTWIVDKSIRTPSNVLLVALAVPDLIIGLFCIPVLAVKQLTTTWILGN